MMTISNSSSTRSSGSSNHRTSILLCLFAFSRVMKTTTAWEIPSFLLDDISSSGTSSDNSFSLSSDFLTKDDERHLANETVLDKPIFTDQGFLDEGNTTSASPTESPAPSPSPSDTPTIRPTITGNPSSKPTSTPTESPAPSPSPTEIPSSAPSNPPSIPPSESPTSSHPPSMLPSAKPSNLPTTMPSIAPSTSPTISHQPSALPSFNPSDAPTSLPSVYPSSSPTLVTDVSADFTVALPIETGGVLLNTTQITAFEDATEQFLSSKNDVTLTDGTIADIQVQLMGQMIIDVSNVNTTTTSNNSTSNGMTRQLQQFNSNSNNNLSLQQKLVLDFVVLALYSGPDNTFDLEKGISTYFHNTTSKWYTYLSNADPIFVSLTPKPPSPSPDDGNAEIENGGSNNTNGGSSNKGVSGGTIAIVTILALVSLTIGVSASIYTVRQYQRNIYGQELLSPRNGGDGSVILGSSEEESISNDMNPPKQRHPDYVVPKKHISPTKNPLLSQSMSVTDHEQMKNEPPWMRLPTSPNSLEMGKVIPINEILQKYPKAIDEKQKTLSKIEEVNTMEDLYNNNTNNNSWDHIQPTKSSEGRIDPPSANSIINAPIHPTTTSRATKPVAAAPTAATTNNNTKKNETVITVNRDNMKSLMDTNTEISDMTRSHLGGHEILLTKSMGGTLGAKPASGSVANFSDFSDHNKSFFEQRQLHQYDDKNKNNDASKEGSRRVVGPDRTSMVRDDSLIQGPVPAVHVRSYESATTSAGLYDVFAPPGPIGIVVDTTKDGPAVHSLKRTSPMLGLINPGDLIVALDDEDTRAMNAATLTQLMARKSTQKERKITLLSVDNL